MYKLKLFLFFCLFLFTLFKGTAQVTDWEKEQEKQRREYERQLDSVESIILNQFGTLIRQGKILSPQKSLYRLINEAYIQLNKRPNTILDALNFIDPKGVRLLQSFVGRGVYFYLRDSLYNSFYANEISDTLLLSTRMYNRYLCGCIGLGISSIPYKHPIASLLHRIDSCRQNRHSWLEWEEQQQITNSGDKAKILQADPQAFIAFFMKTCPGFLSLVANDLPVFEGNGAKEQYLLKLNQFHTSMQKSILGLAPIAGIRKYVSASNYKTLQKIILNVQRKREDMIANTKFIFRTDSAIIYFQSKSEKGSSLAPFVRLHYTFTYTNLAFRIQKVTYKPVFAIQGNDRHEASYFPESPGEFRMLPRYRYTGTPFDEYGVPDAPPLPVERIIPSQYTDSLERIFLVPPVD